MKKLVFLAVFVAAFAVTASALGATRVQSDDSGAITIAVYGDAPYGVTNLDETAMRATPALINSINADPNVSLVLHVGDTHSGSDHCYATYPSNPWVNSDTRIFELWSAYQDPLVYTPGDNEWTDCNKKKEGGGAGQDGYYDASQAGHLPGDPLDNLALVRSIFFSNPGWTLGGKMHVQSQAEIGKKSERAFPENVTWNRNNVQFVTINLPGSNNDTLPWYGNGVPKPIDQLQPRQRDEVIQRTAADEVWLARAFQEATDSNAAAVVIGLQADMWDPAQVANGEGINQYDPIAQEIAALSLSFGKPVLLLNGDSHVYNVDHPFTNAFYSSPSTIGDAHHVGYEVPNLTRITVQGSTNAASKWWLKLTIDPGSPGVFSWTPVVLP